MMSDSHEDFLNGLHVVECELKRVIGELDEMQDRRGIPTHDRVSLKPLQWALNKLADDLHDATVEIRRARLEVVSARRGAEDAREVRDAASQLHLLECRKYNAGMEQRLALETQVAGLSSKVRELEKQLAEMKGREELQNVFSAGQAGKILGLEGVVESLTAERDSLKQQVAELTEKLGELPTETAPESYQWQECDEVINEHTGIEMIVMEARDGCVRLFGWNHAVHQKECERRGWRLLRKASAPPPSPQQVADFAAVTEPIDDSTGAGEGQS